MSQLNNKGPENLGSGTGRKLGLCQHSIHESVNNYQCGTGMGLRRKSDNH